MPFWHLGLVNAIEWIGVPSCTTLYQYSITSGSSATNAPPRHWGATPRYSPSVAAAVVPRIPSATGHRRGATARMAPVPSATTPNSARWIGEIWSQCVARSPRPRVPRNIATLASASAPLAAARPVNERAGRPIVPGNCAVSINPRSASTPRNTAVSGRPSIEMASDAAIATPITSPPRQAPPFAPSRAARPLSAASASTICQP